VKRYAPHIILTLLLAGQSFAQGPVTSPRDSSKIIFDGAQVSIAYGKPAVRGRAIFGNVVPYYKVWRTGAGEATLLRTDVDLEMDGAIIPRGSYSLYSIPSEERWKLIINKQTGQWGTVYDPKLDLARIEVEPRPMTRVVEELSMRFEKTATDRGILRVEWERTAVAIPFHVSKDILVASPRDSAVLQLGAARIAVDYGRPSMRGRSIFGGVVPYGKVWRTGANEATALTTTADLLLGGKALPRGSYTLYTIPGSREWTIIISKQTGQWGTVFSAKNDLFRTKAKRTATRSTTEKLTVELRSTGPTAGELRITWERTLVRIPFTLKQSE